jgi:hypothetical protein
MTTRLAAIAALLCALPARGADAPLSALETDTLTMTDALPTTAQLDFATQPTPGLTRLLGLAKDSTTSVAIQIRAIRLLPLYCPVPGANCAGTTIHDTLLAIVQSYVTALRQTGSTTLPVSDQLRLRAAIEALGVTRSALPADVDALTLEPQSLLHNASRDVRVTVVRALRDLRNCAAIAPLQMLGASETNAQVQQAILGALQSLQAPGTCS